MWGLTKYWLEGHEVTYQALVEWPHGDLPDEEPKAWKYCYHFKDNSLVQNNILAVKDHLYHQHGTYQVLVKGKNYNFPGNGWMAK